MSTNSPDLTQVDALWQELQSCEERRLSRVFRDYCESALSAYEAGQFKSDIAGRYIARAMFVPGLDKNPTREAITMYAGELEVPQPEDQASRRWQAIRDLLSEL